MRSRRLLLMGHRCQRTGRHLEDPQATLAAAKWELHPDELRETLIMLAPYAGYPNISGLVVPCEEVIGTWLADGSPAGLTRTSPDSATRSVPDLMFTIRFDGHPMEVFSARHRRTPRLAVRSDDSSTSIAPSDGAVGMPVISVIGASTPAAS